MKRLLLVLGILLALASPAPARASTWFTGAGPTRVHYFAPDGYDWRTAVVVVYLHGFGTDVDRAWREHHLPEQFADTELNALFLAPETRDAAGQPVSGPAGLDRLVEPGDRVVLVGHSGAYRQIAAWLDDRRVVAVVLLDAAYGSARAIGAWQRQPGHLLVVVGNSTFPSAARWFPGAILQQTIDSHMGIVTEGTWIPWSLQQLWLGGYAARTTRSWER